MTIHQFLLMVLVPSTGNLYIYGHYLGVYEKIITVLVPSTGNLYIYNVEFSNVMYDAVLVPSTGNLYIYRSRVLDVKFPKMGSRPLHGESIYLQYASEIVKNKKEGSRPLHGESIYLQCVLTLQSVR